VTGYSERMLSTRNMLGKSLLTQRKWRISFDEEKKRILDRKDELVKAARIKDPAEKEARIAELEREKESEGTEQLPDPILYPIDPSMRACPTVGNMRTGKASPAAAHRQQASRVSSSADGGHINGVLYDEYATDNNNEGRGRYYGNDEEDCDDESQCTGIPNFPLIMRVDIQGKFGKEKSVLAFQSKFGGLPARAMLDITEMMYKSSMQKKQKSDMKGRKRKASGGACDGIAHPGAEESGDLNVDNNGESRSAFLLPKDIFLPEPKIVQPFSRLKMFKPDEFTMDGFKKAGCDAHLLDRIMGVVRNTNDYAEKIDLFDDHLVRIVRQHVSGVLNNDLRSNHALYTVKYVEQAKQDVCKDLRTLIGQVAPSFYNFMSKDKAASQMQKRNVYCVMDEAYAQEAYSPSYWHLNSSNTFVSYSWLMDDMLRDHNERFFYLTAQNLKICNDVWTGMVQFRLRQNENWVYIGMTTVICDAAAKVKKAPVNGFGGSSQNMQSQVDGITNTAKKPSAGLDLIREVLDNRRISYRYAFMF
jgi:hypothetical protein